MADIVRKNITDIVDRLDEKSESSEEAADNVYKYFKNLSESNNTYYKNLIGLLISDHYKLLNLSLYDGSLNEDNKVYLDLYNESCDIDYIINMIDENPEILDILISKSYEFYSYDYFSKREILLNCKDKISKLDELSCFNKYDYLYYCKKYDLNTIRAIYGNCKINGMDKDTILKNLINQLNELYLSDSDNYLEIISEIFVEYYKIGVYELEHNKRISKPSRRNKAIKLLRKQDVDCILHKTSDDDFMSEILRRIINFRDKNVNLDNLDESDNVVVKKLFQIKEYYN